MNENTRTMPVDSLSYSAFTQLLRNPLIFKLKQVLGVYDGKRSMASMIGSSGHEALKFYYGGDKDRPVPADPIEARGLATETGLTFMADYHDAYINYGKQGSREAMLKGYAQAMQFYWAEEPVYHEILACEEKMTAEITSLEGQPFPLPAVAIPDLVHKRADGGIEAVDMKFTKKFTQYENDDGEPHEDYIKIVQAMFLFYVLKGNGILIDRVLFREVKWSENKKENAGTPQVRDYAIPTDHEPYHIIFKNLYKDVVRYLASDPIFLPNLSDPFDGEQAGLLYAQGLISADMSDVEVMHKVADVARVHKSFVASRLERAENSHLPPEQRIKMRLGEFGIPLEVAETKETGSFIQYRFKVSSGVRMTTIEKHLKDIAAVLETKGQIIIHAPIKGTSLLGVEVEKEKRESIKFSQAVLQMGTLSLPVGIDAEGVTHYLPLPLAPHLLIAGTTGSGKSVLVSNFITAMTKQKTPEELKLILIDPKRVELAPFARKPHVMAINGRKVLFDQEDALKALLWAVGEMETRYQVLEDAGKRNIEEFNLSKRSEAKKLPFVVIVIDELADLMLRSAADEKGRKKASYPSKGKRWLYKELLKRAGKSRTVFVKDDETPEELRRIDVTALGDFQKDDLIDILENLDDMDETKSPEANVEHLIVRLAQQGRAAGIHMIAGTQRPSSDVVTGLIKANFPTRIALMTASPQDSVVILGTPGAEKLSGKGDMIYRFHANRSDVRLQGFAN